MDRLQRRDFGAPVGSLGRVAGSESLDFPGGVVPCGVDAADNDAAESSLQNLGWQDWERVSLPLPFSKLDRKADGSATCCGSTYRLDRTCIEISKNSKGKSRMAESWFTIVLGSVLPHSRRNTCHHDKLARRIFRRSEAQTLQNPPGFLPRFCDGGQF